MLPKTYLLHIFATTCTQKLQYRQLPRRSIQLDLPAGQFCNHPQCFALTITLINSPSSLLTMGLMGAFFVFVFVNLLPEGI